MKIYLVSLLLLTILPFIFSSCSSGGGGSDGDAVLDGDVASSINALTLTIVGETGQNATFVFDSAADLTSITGFEEGNFTYTADTGSEFISASLTGSYFYEAVNQDTGVITLSDLIIVGGDSGDSVPGETYFDPSFLADYVINLNFLNPIANQFEEIGVILSTTDFFGSGSDGPIDSLQLSALTAVEDGPLPIRYRGIPPSGLEDLPDFNDNIPVTLHNLHFLLVRGNELIPPSPIRADTNTRDERGNVVGILVFTSDDPNADSLADTGQFMSVPDLATFDDEDLAEGGNYTYERDENGGNSARLTLFGAGSIRIAFNTFFSDNNADPDADPPIPANSNTGAGGSGNIFNGSNSLKSTQLFIIRDDAAFPGVRSDTE